jgi:hypothetical protein
MCILHIKPLLVSYYYDMKAHFTSDDHYLLYYQLQCNLVYNFSDYNKANISVYYLATDLAIKDSA